MVNSGIRLEVLPEVNDVDGFPLIWRIDDLWLQGPPSNLRRYGRWSHLPEVLSIADRQRILNIHVLIPMRICVVHSPGPLPGRCLS